ncbi:hypothetical protein BU15DRAFT_60644 [Melanogaster broomeanus]|nr:hypothetical protein BU15DRAFT_60644 [Melanogaster broomeanus]
MTTAMGFSTSTVAMGLVVLGLAELRLVALGIWEVIGAVARSMCLEGASAFEATVIVLQQLSFFSEVIVVPEDLKEVAKVGQRSAPGAWFTFIAFSTTSFCLATSLNRFSSSNLTFSTHVRNATSAEISVERYSKAKLGCIWASRWYLRAALLRCEVEPRRRAAQSEGSHVEWTSSANSLKVIASKVSVLLRYQSRTRGSCKFQATLATWSAASTERWRKYWRHPISHARNASGVTSPGVMMGALCAAACSNLPFPDILEDSLYADGEGEESDDEDEDESDEYWVGKDDGDWGLDWLSCKGDDGTDDNGDSENSDDDSLLIKIW